MKNFGETIHLISVVRKLVENFKRLSVPGSTLSQQDRNAKQIFHPQFNPKPQYSHVTFCCSVCKKPFQEKCYSSLLFMGVYLTLQVSRHGEHCLFCLFFLCEVVPDQIKQAIFTRHGSTLSTCYSQKPLLHNLSSYSFRTDRAVIEDNFPPPSLACISQGAT